MKIPREYNEGSIALCLARGLFARDLVVVDNCGYTGYECDLLVVTPRLQIIDVEIKISKADLKADREKNKWHVYLDWEQRAELEKKLGRRATRDEARVPREWPLKVWKHYYAMPRELYTPDLDHLCNPRSGIITVQFRKDLAPTLWHHNVVRRAKADKNYQPLKPEGVVQVARLASIRMWESWKMEKAK